MVIRVLVVDDHPVVAQGVANVVDGDTAIDVVGAASTAAEAVRCAESLRPDVVLLDVRLPDSDVVATVRGIAAASASSAVVLFTGDTGHRDVRAALEAGALGVVAKDALPADLRTAIRAAADGTRTVPSSPVEPSPSALTPRQHDVLQCVATGMTNSEIAEQLHLKPATVKAYWQEAMQRLGVRNRAEAIAVAYRDRIL